MDTFRTREEIKIYKNKSKIGHKLRNLHPISVTKPKSIEKTYNHHEIFYNVNNAIAIVTLLHTSYVLLLRKEKLTCEIIFSFIQQFKFRITLFILMFSVIITYLNKNHII